MADKSNQQLDQLIRDGTNHVLENLEVSGTVTIIDKDGKVKAELPITSIEAIKEDQNDGT